MEALPLSCTKIVSSRSQVECCKFSPTGDILAACFSDGSVRLYSVSVDGDSSVKAELKHSFREHQSNVWCISFSSDGHYLSSCSSDHNTIIYSLSTLSVLHILKYHLDTVWCCHFSTQGMIATGSKDCTVKICNQETGNLLHTLTKFKSSVIDLSFNGNGDKLCTASNDGGIVLWLNLHQTAYPTELYITSDVSRFCKFIDFSSDNYIMCLSTHDHCVNILDIKEGVGRHSKELLPTNSSTSGNCLDITSQVKCIQQFSGHCNIVWSICCLGKDYQTAVLVTCSGDRTIRFFACLRFVCF